MDIREAIRRAFKNSGLSERELARRMRCSTSQVNYLMSGERRWNEDWIPRFCEALNISLEKLVCAETNTFPYFNNEWIETHNDLEVALGDPEAREMLVGMIQSAATAASKKAGEKSEKKRAS